MESKSVLVAIFYTYGKGKEEKKAILYAVHKIRIFFLSYGGHLSKLFIVSVTTFETQGIYSQKLHRYCPVNDLITPDLQGVPSGGLTRKSACTQGPSLKSLPVVLN